MFNATYGDVDYKGQPHLRHQGQRQQLRCVRYRVLQRTFGLKDWSFNATGGWFEEDHDIDFYDNSAGIFMLGMFRKF